MQASFHDMLADGIRCGLHRIKRLMRLQALKARPRRRRLPPDLGERQVAAVAANVLDRTFVAPAPNRKWIADFTYVWTAEGWLYVAVVIDLFSRRVVGWSMSAEMTAQLVPYSPGAVGPIAGKEARSNLGAELFIAPAAPTARSCQPGIEPTPRDTERPAQPIRRPDPPVLRNEGELHVDSFAK